MTNTTNTTPTSGAADLPEALRSIQRFEVVDYIDDKHVPAVIPKPPGPWVRYEDHSAALAAGQATAAQATPAYKDSTPEMHVGDSAFESWYSAYSPAHKGDKQRARDAYAAGMGDPLATAAPAAVAGPSDDETQELPGIVDKALNELAGFVKFLETVNGSWNSRTARNALRDIEWFARRKRAAAAPTTQPAPQPSPAVQGDALDAARYRYLRDGDWREHDKLESIIRLQLNTLWDAKIDAARAAQEQVHGDDTARKQGGAT